MLMVSAISDTDEDFKVYKIPVQDFIKTFNIKSNNIYKELEVATDNLLKKIIKIPIEEWGNKKIFKTALASSFKYNVDGTGIIESTFHPDLKPYLLSLKNRFLIYDMMPVGIISSPHSIQLYEFLKSFEGIGRRTIEVEELKAMLCVEDKYSRYYNFKKKVIEQAQKDLSKHTDISFTFDEIKRPWSKSVYKLKFYISSNRWKINQPKLELQQEKDLPQWVSVLTQYGFSSDFIRQNIISQHSKEYVIETVKRCEHDFMKGKVANKSGYIRKALEKEYFKQQIEQAQQRQKEYNKKTAEADYMEKRKAAHNVYLLKLMEERLRTVEAEKVEEWKQEFEEGIQSNMFFKKAFGSRKHEHPIVQAQRKNFLKEKLLTKQECDIDNFSK